jgi:hypothetical protein
VLGAAALSGCGEVHLTYGARPCPDDEPPAIIVEFVASSDGEPVAIQASGTVRDGTYVDRMVPTGSHRAAPGRTYALAGGYGREGSFDVRVETAPGEIREWSRVPVHGDRCGPFTVVLQARLSRLQ